MLARMRSLLRRVCQTSLGSLDNKTVWQSVLLPKSQRQLLFSAILTVPTSLQPDLFEWRNEWTAMPVAFPFLEQDLQNNRFKTQASQAQPAQSGLCQENQRKGGGAWEKAKGQLLGHSYRSHSFGMLWIPFGMLLVSFSAVQKCANPCVSFRSFQIPIFTRLSKTHWVLLGAATATCRRRLRSDGKKRGKKRKRGQITRESIMWLHVTTVCEFFCWRQNT